MNEVWITHAAAVTGLGTDLEQTWQRLALGETAVRPLELFPTERYGAGNAAWIEGLGARGGHSRLYPLLERLLYGFGPIPPTAA